MPFLHAYLLALENILGAGGVRLSMGADSLWGPSYILIQSLDFSASFLCINLVSI